MLRPLGPREVIASIVIVSLMATSTLLYVRARATYRNETDIAVLRLELRTLRQAIENDNAGVRVELSEIERTLYGQPAAKQTETRRPSGLEQWQVNRDKRFNDRISDVERRLYRLEK